MCSSLKRNLSISAVPNSAASTSRRFSDMKEHFLFAIGSRLESFTRPREIATGRTCWTDCFFFAWPNAVRSALAGQLFRAQSKSNLQIAHTELTSLSSRPSSRTVRTARQIRTSVPSCRRLFLRAAARSLDVRGGAAFVEFRVIFRSSLHFFADFRSSFQISGYD